MVGSYSERNLSGVSIERGYGEWELKISDGDKKKLDSVTMTVIFTQISYGE